MRTASGVRLAVGVVCLLAAYAMLYPGLTLPMLSVSGTVEKSALVELGKELLLTSGEVPSFLMGMAERFVNSIEVDGRVLVFDKTRSILQTSRELYANDHRPVAVLIVLFSVVVPALKAVILLLATLPLYMKARITLLRIATASSKWSMADVFVIAVFVAYLGANGLQESRGLVDFESQLGTGFNYFTAYCLLSILGTQLIGSALSAHWASRPSDIPSAAEPA